MKRYRSTRITTNALRSRRGAALALAAASALTVAGLALPTAAEAAPAPAPPAPASATSGTVANIAHLDFLLDSVPLTGGIAGHSTYDQASEPTAEAPWVYADHEADGTFQRVGGGAITDAAKGWYAQGAFDADDIARSAVVYLRDWTQNGTASSRKHAYELLRELTYLQTTTGPSAGDVVLWQQSDGTLNPSAIPADNPNPSDSANSYWLARTVWALGEGYADFKGADPSFARFLAGRMDLSLAALSRESLSTYGKTVVSNGSAVPSWLITGSAGATGEAVLGLASYVTANPADRAARTALTESANGIAVMQRGGLGSWPFGAILPETTDLGQWHAWSGLAPDALAAAGKALRRPDLLNDAQTSLAQFTAQLLASGGPDNGLTPTPTDTSQIAYGADSLVESLLTTADDTGDKGLDALAAVAAGWYFGANPAGVAVYDPATGVGVDGISSTGVPNTNFGAESTIHTELSMLALDAHPAVRALATSLTTVTAVQGQTTVEPDAALTTATTVTFTMPALTQPAMVYPVVARGTAPSGSTSWVATGGSSARAVPLGTTANGGAGAQGVAASAVLTTPLSLGRQAPAGTTTVTGAVRGTATVESLLVEPVVEHLGLSGANGSYDVYVNGSAAPVTRVVTAAGTGLVTVARYDSSGRLLGTSRQSASTVHLPLTAGGFATVSR